MRILNRFLVLIIISTLPFLISNCSQPESNLKIQVIVDQTYEEDWYGKKETLLDVYMPIEEICMQILRAADAGLPKRNRIQDEIVLMVKINGIAMGRAYSIFNANGQVGQGPSFSGAEVSGTLILTNATDSIYKYFAGTKPLPESVTERLTAANAPFNAALFSRLSLVPAILDAINQIWGTNTNKNTKLRGVVEELNPTNI